MLKGIFNAVIGTRFDREMKKLRPIVDAILEHEKALVSVSEEELKGKTQTFQTRIRDRVEAIETELAELKDQRRHTEEPADRERLTQRMAEAEDELR